MNSLKDDWIEDIIWTPYAYEDFDVEDIKMRMSLLTPQNSFTVFQSKQNEKTEQQLLVEKWYGSKYSFEKMSDDLIKELQLIMPDNLTQIGHPPVNKYMPYNLVQKKAEKGEEAKSSLPKLICKEPKVWFKQDDTFDQPFIMAKFKIRLNDC